MSEKGASCKRLLRHHKSNGSMSLPEAEDELDEDQEAEEFRFLFAKWSVRTERRSDLEVRNLCRLKPLEGASDGLYSVGIYKQ